MIGAVCHDRHPDSLPRQRGYQLRTCARIADGKNGYCLPA
jgi:hypothetical protein